MQQDTRCFFGRPCISSLDSFFTYKKPAETAIKLAHLGASVTVNPNTYHSSSCKPSAALPLLKSNAFEIAVKRSVLYWINDFYRNLRNEPGALETVCDKIAEDIWFAVVACRLSIFDTKIFTRRINHIIKHSIDQGMGKGSGSNEKIEKFLITRISKIWLHQIDIKSVTWTSQVLVREYMDICLKYIRHSSSMEKYVSSPVLLIVQQYIGVHLQEYKSSLPRDSSNWLISFIEDRRASSRVSFDFLHASHRVYDITDYHELSNETDTVMFTIWTGQVLSNGLKELHSIEYYETFGTAEIPEQLFYFMNREWLYIDDHFHLDYVDPDMLKSYLKDFLDACLPDKFEKTLRKPLLDLILADSDERADCFYEVLITEGVTEETSSLIDVDCISKDFIEMILDSFRVFPADPVTLNQMRLQFIKKIEAKLNKKNQNSCYIRHGQCKLDFDDTLMKFFFEPIALSETNADEIWKNRKYVKNSFTTCPVVTPRPVRSKSTSTASLPKSDAEVGAAKSKGGSSGLKGGFFNKPAKKQATTPTVFSPEVVGTDLQIALSNLCNIFSEFHEKCFVDTRQEPLSQSQITGLETEVNRFFASCKQNQSDLVKMLGQKSAKDAEICQNILSRGSESEGTERPWFSEYQEPEYYMRYFNGKNKEYYSEWRINLLNKCVDVIRSEKTRKTDRILEIFLTSLRSAELSKEVTERFQNKETEIEGLLSVLNLWDIRYGYREPETWETAKLKQKIMEAISGIESDADYEAALFACSWPVKDYEAFIERVSMLRS
jgi:hypothetical protein